MKKMNQMFRIETIYILKTSLQIRCVLLTHVVQMCVKIATVDVHFRNFQFGISTNSWISGIPSFLDGWVGVSENQNVPDSRF